MLHLQLSLLNSQRLAQLGGYAEARQSLEELKKHDQTEDMVPESIEVQRENGSTGVAITKHKALEADSSPVIFLMLSHVSLIT